jgi:hypothetical protein
MPQLPGVLALNPEQSLEVCGAMNTVIFQELVQGHPTILSVMRLLDH